MSETKLYVDKGSEFNFEFCFSQALTLALTLHEKGRSVLKKRSYAEALLLLLEAEKEFGYCDQCIFYFVYNICPDYPKLHVTKMNGRDFN